MVQVDPMAHLLEDIDRDFLTVGLGAYGSATITYGAENIEQILVSVDFAGILESKDLDFGAPQYTKYIDGILLEISADKEMNIQFGHRWRLTDALEWTEPFPVQGNQLTHIRIPESRYYRLRIFDPAPNIAWHLTAIQLYGRAVGTRRANSA